MKLLAWEEQDTDHLTQIQTVLQKSRDHDTFIKSMRPSGKCLRCLERQYLKCSLSDTYCKDTKPFCRADRSGNHFLIGPVPVREDE